MPCSDVTPGQTIRLLARHDTYAISFTQQEGGTAGGGSGVQPQLTDWWAQAQQVSAMHGRLAQQVAADPLQFRRLALAAVELAAQPEAHGAPPGQAAALCARMLS
jgi:hypothetical protein